MAYLSLELLAVVALFFVVGGLTIACLLWLTQKDRVAIREITDVMMGHYQRVVQGAKELTLNNSRKYFFSQKIFATSSEIRNRGRRIFNLLALVEQWAQLLLFALLGIIIFLVSDYLPLSMEIIAGYVITLLFLLEPIDVIINGSDELIDAKVAFDKIDRLQLSQVDGWDQLEPPRKPNNIASPGAKIELESVKYSYAVNQKGSNTILPYISLLTG